MNQGHHQVDILVVEDSPTQAEQLRYLLEQDRYRVAIAGDGNQALAFLSRQKPNLIISDIVMPGMNGYELCQRIKSNANTWDILVILLTALSSKQDVIKGLVCKADSFITKPYSEAYLLRHIQETLSDPPSRQERKGSVKVEIGLDGNRHVIPVNPQQMVSLLFSTYEAAVHRNTELAQTQDKLRSLNENLEDLVEVRTAALSTEISERKRAQAVLEVSEARTRTIIEHSTDGIIIVDRAGTICFVNPSTEVIFGRAAQQLVGAGFGYAIGDVSEIEVIDPNLESRVVEMRSTEIIWEDQPAFLASLRDITEKKQIEKAEKQLIKIKEEFIAGVSHDLRTPISSIVGFLALLRSGQVEDRIEQEEFLTRMAWDADHLMTMVNELLDFSQIDRDYLSLNWKTFDLSALIIELLQSFKHLPGMKDITFQHNCKDKPLVIEADQSRVRRVLINLIENAIKFSEEGGTVFVMGEIESDHIVLKVMDNGCGISEENQSKIFEKYFQVEGTPQRAKGGIGLGLYTSKKIIEEHGGSMRLKSKTGLGSTFTVTLPQKRLVP